MQNKTDKGTLLVSKSLPVANSYSEIRLFSVIKHNISQGTDISKNEFNVMMEAYKVDSSDRLSLEQKSKLKHLHNKAADSIKEYCQEYLRINGRLDLFQSAKFEIPKSHFGTLKWH